MSHPSVDRPQANRTLETLAHPALVIDGTGQLVAHNEAARSLLDRRDGLSLVQRRLVLGDRNARQRLRAILDTRAGAAPNALLVPRPSGQPAYQAVVKPLESGAGQPALWRVAISDPASVTPHMLATIASLYALTPAETRLAGLLMLGATAEESSCAIGVSVATVRSQLSSLLRKTGTRRQAELVRVFSAVPS